MQSAASRARAQVAWTSAGVNEEELVARASGRPHDMLFTRTSAVLSTPVASRSLERGFCPSVKRTSSPGLRPTPSKTSPTWKKIGRS
jgi:hypothetical protein